MSHEMITSSHGSAQLFNLVAYIGGAALVVIGVLKLKEHVDNPSHVQMRGGMIRLLAAGMLLSLPFMTNVMQNDVSRGNANAALPSVVQVSQFGTTGGAFSGS
jgi:hypothetical protein